MENNKIKLPPPPPGELVKSFLSKIFIAIFIAVAFFSAVLSVFWFFGVIVSSLFFPAKNFSLNFTQNVIHGGAFLASLILFWAIGNCIQMIFARVGKKK